MSGRGGGVSWRSVVLVLISVRSGQRQASCPFWFHSAPPCPRPIPPANAAGEAPANTHVYLYLHNARTLIHTHPKTHSSAHELMHTHTHSHSCDSHSHTLRHTCTRSLTCTHIASPRHTLTHTFPHVCTHECTLTPLHAVAQPHTHVLPRAHSCSRVQTHSPAYTLTHASLWDGGPEEYGIFQQDAIECLLFWPRAATAARLLKTSSHITVTEARFGELKIAP